MINNLWWYCDVQLFSQELPLLCHVNPLFVKFLGNILFFFSHYMVNYKDEYIKRKRSVLKQFPHQR